MCQLIQVVSGVGIALQISDHAKGPEIKSVIRTVNRGEGNVFLILFHSKARFTWVLAIISRSLKQPCIALKQLDI